MSAYTSIVAQVLQARYDQSAYWSNVPQNSIQANACIEARIASILRPGTLFNNNGFFGYKNIGTYPHQQPRGKTEFEGMYFRLPTLGFENVTIPYDQYLTSGAWFRKDWRVSDLQNAGLNIQYITLLGKARRIYDRIAGELTWIPAHISAQWDAAMGAGGLPLMRPLSYFRDVGEYPSFLSTEGRRAAWEQIRGMLQRIQQKVSAANLAKLDREANQLESDSQFWDTIAKWSGVDFIEGKFKELKAKVVEFNQNQNAAEDSITRTQALVNSNPEAFPTASLQEFEALKTKTTDQKNQARLALKGPVMDALVGDGMAIGIAPVVLIVIGVAVVTAAAVTMTTFVVMSEGTKRQAMQLESEFLKQRDEFDQKIWESQQGSIDSRIADLQAQLDGNLIDQGSFDTQVRALEAQRRQSQSDLLARRQQTQSQADDLARHQKETMQTGFVSALSNIKGMAMWGAVGAVAIMVVPRLLKKKA